MPKYWFDHIHLLSRDPAKTAEFYEKTFDARSDGLSELPGGRTLASVSFDGASIKITKPRTEPLGPHPLPDDCGLEHFGLRTDDIEEAVADLEGKGLKCVRGINPISPTARIAFFLSPEDILIELLEVRD